MHVASYYNHLVTVVSGVFELRNLQQQAGHEWRDWPQSSLSFDMIKYTSGERPPVLKKHFGDI